MGEVKRDRSTSANRDFWDAVDEAAMKVATWPAWKKGGEMEDVKDELRREREAHLRTMRRLAEAADVIRNLLAYRQVTADRHWEDCLAAEGWLEANAHVSQRFPTEVEGEWET